MERLEHFIKYRPLTLIGLITALHSLVYGIGYALDLGGFDGTILYHNINDVTSPVVFGVLLIVAAFAVAYGFLSERSRFVDVACKFNAVLWLFAFLLYGLHGAWLLGAGIGLVWSVMSGYVGLAFKMQDDIVEHLATERLTD